MAPSFPSSRSVLRRSLLSVGPMLALTLTMAACSTDALEPSERMSGVRPAARMQPDREARPAGTARDPVAASASPIPAEGVDIDGMVTAGSSPPSGGGLPSGEGLPAGGVVGLAEEQSRDIHAGSSGYPYQTASAGPVLVDGIGTNSVHVLSVPARETTAGAASAAAAEADPDLPPLTPERMAMEERRKAQFLEQEQRTMRERRDRRREEQVAFLPRGGHPVGGMSEPDVGERMPGPDVGGRMPGPEVGGRIPGPDVGGRMPASEVACRQRLTKLGVTFADVPRISNGPSCGIDHPIQLSGLSGGIAVKPAVKLNCEVTEAFALWVKNELAPSARYRYLSGIGTIKPLGGYSCRTMNSRRGAAMSEHAHGNAIDVGKFVLKNGKAIDVRKPGFFAFREKGLLKAVRQDSCKYFNTVLGPGSDPFHKDHFHFDLRERKSGYRHCD